MVEVIKLTIVLVITHGITSGKIKVQTSLREWKYMLRDVFNQFSSGLILTGRLDFTTLFLELKGFMSTRPRYEALRLGMVARTLSTAVALMLSCSFLSHDR